MRFPGHLLNLRIPLMFQHLLDSNWVILLRKSIFQTMGCIFWDIATIVRAD